MYVCMYNQLLAAEKGTKLSTTFSKDVYFSHINHKGLFEMAIMCQELCSYILAIGICYGEGWLLTIQYSLHITF